MSSPPLYGLILAGGASKRMGTDKALLAYRGQPQLERSFQLLNTICEHTYVSVRADQSNEPMRAKLPQIVDTLPAIGPLAGIASALLKHQDVAWLVVACDLPFLSRDAILHLV